MFCLNCGKELPEGANCCPICGTLADKTIPKNVPVTAAAQVGVAVPVADTAPVANDNAAQNAPPVTNAVPVASAAVPKTGKGREKLLITLLSVVSALLVLTLVASVVKMPGTNKSIISSLSDPKGMVEPGAASEQELIDTINRHTLLSEDCIKLMSNSTLVSIYNATDKLAPLSKISIISGEPEEVNHIILADVLRSHMGDTDYDYDLYKHNLDNITLHIDTPNRGKTLYDLGNWPYTYVLYSPDGAASKLVDLLDGENKVVEKACPVSGYIRYADGEEHEFDAGSECLIIKANGRYYIHLPFCWSDVIEKIGN